MEQNILKNAALKSTKKRQVLLLLLQKQARPMTAEELHALAEPILPMNVSTVYRTLNTLTEKKILIRSVRQDGKAYYSLAKKDHSHRLVCDLCGKVIPVDTCPLSELEETLQQKTGFRITGHSLEFTGLCPECSKKDTDEKIKSLWQEVTRPLGKAYFLFCPASQLSEPLISFLGKLFSCFFRPSL